MGQRRGHLLLGHHQAGVELAAGDVVPTGHQAEHPGAAAHVGAHVGLAPGAGPIGKVLAVHVDAVEGLRRRYGNDAVDVADGHPSVFQGGLGGLEGQLFRRFQGPAHELGQPGPKHGYSILVRHLSLAAHLKN